MDLFKIWQGIRYIMHLFVTNLVFCFVWYSGIVLGQVAASETLSVYVGSSDLALTCVGNLVVFFSSCIRGGLYWEIGAKDVLATLTGPKLRKMKWFEGINSFALTTCEEGSELRDCSVVILSPDTPNSSMRQFAEYIANVYDVRSVLLQYFPLQYFPCTLESCTCSDTCGCIVLCIRVDQSYIIRILDQRMPGTIKRISDSLCLLPSANCLRNGCHGCNWGMLHVHEDSTLMTVSESRLITKDPAAVSKSRLITKDPGAVSESRLITKETESRLITEDPGAVSESRLITKETESRLITKYPVAISESQLITEDPGAVSESRLIKKETESRLITKDPGAISESRLITEEPGAVSESLDRYLHSLPGSCFCIPVPREVCIPKPRAVDDDSRPVDDDDDSPAVCIPEPRAVDDWTELLMTSFECKDNFNTVAHYSTTSVILPRLTEILINFVLTFWLRMDGFSGALVARMAVRESIVDDNGRGFAASVFMTSKADVVSSSTNCSTKVCQAVVFRGNPLTFRTLSFIAGCVNLICSIGWAVLVGLEGGKNKWYDTHSRPPSKLTFYVIMASIVIVLGMDCIDMYLSWRFPKRCPKWLSRHYFGISIRRKDIVCKICMICVIILEIVCIALGSAMARTLGVRVFGRWTYSCMQSLVWVKWGVGSYLLRNYSEKRTMYLYSSAFFMNAILAGVRTHWNYS